MQEPAVTSERLTIRRLLEPWMHVLRLSSTVQTSDDPAVGGYCIAGRAERRYLEALTLLMLAERVNPGVVADLAIVFHTYQHSANTSIRASTDVYEDLPLLEPFFGHQPLEAGPFLEAVRALKALGQLTETTVVIPIAVRVQDRGQLKARDYSEHLAKLLSCPPSTNTEVRFEATSTHVSLTARSLFPKLVEGMTNLARDSTSFAITDVAIDPFLVSCTSSKFDSFIAAAARNSSAMTVSITAGYDRKQYRVGHVVEAVPKVCRALGQLNHFSEIAVGTLLCQSRSPRAWRAVLDAIVSLLVRTDNTAATVDKLSLVMPCWLLGEDDAFLFEWVAANPANKSLLSSTTISTLNVNDAGLHLLRILLPSLDCVQCSSYVKQGMSGWGMPALELFSLAPSKFVSIRSVAIDFEALSEAELGAIASLPRLEELSLNGVSLNHEALLRFIASLLPPPPAATSSWQRRQFTTLRLMNCTSMGKRNSRGIANEAMGQLLLTVLSTNRYLASVAVLDHDAKADVWRQIQAHDGGVVLAQTDTQGLCAFLSVLHAQQSRLTGGANLDAFTVRRIIEFCHPHAVRRVHIVMY